jgi:hypothetical protein
MLHVELQPEIEAKLAAEARARGMAADRYAATILTENMNERQTSETPAEAVAAIRQGRKGILLQGLKISDLIREGRRE